MQLETALRWIAHAWGVLSTLTLLAFAFGGNEALRMTAAEAVGFLCFPIGLIVGFAVAWRREGVGGLISLASLGLFYAWHASRTGVWPGGPYFLLFAAPAFLHLASSLVDRHRSAIGRA